MNQSKLEILINRNARFHFARISIDLYMDYMLGLYEASLGKSDKTAETLTSDRNELMKLNLQEKVYIYTYARKQPNYRKAADYFKNEFIQLNQ